MGKRVNYCLCIHVCDWYSDWPSGKPVDDGQQMIESIRRRHGDEIEMQVLESFWRNREICDRRHHMFVNFGLLTWDTFPGPFTDVLFNIGPNEFICNRLSGPFDPRVA